MLQTKLTPSTIEQMAYEIRRFLLDHLVWIDVCIYFNGKRLSTDLGKNFYYNKDVICLEENINPRDYFEYTGNILCMSFEGELYHVLHYGYDKESEVIRNGLYQIFKKYGCFHEFGDAWNLALYEMNELPYIVR